MRLGYEKVSMFGIRPEVVFGIALVESELRQDYDGEIELVITSGTEQASKHSRTSLHYTGCAVDIRSRTLPVGDRKDFTAKVNGKLGGDYDFILEDFNGPNEHFHLEFQPKRRG